jgi:hypothetical protein
MTKDTNIGISFWIQSSQKQKGLFNGQFLIMDIGTPPVVCRQKNSLRLRKKQFSIFGNTSEPPSANFRLF